MHLSGSGWKFLYSGYLSFMGPGCWALLVPWSFQQLPFVDLSLFTKGSSVSSVGPLDRNGYRFIADWFPSDYCQLVWVLDAPMILCGMAFQQVRFSESGVIWPGVVNLSKL